MNVIRIIIASSSGVPCCVCESLHVCVHGRAPVHVLTVSSGRFARPGLIVCVAGWPERKRELLCSALGRHGFGWLAGTVCAEGGD